MKLSSLFTIFLTLISISAYSQSETRTVGRFDEIHVSHGIEVILTEEGNYGELYLEVENVNLNDVVTEVNRGVLRIKFSDYNFWKEERYDRRDIRIEIPVDELVAIEINTGALVETEGILVSESLEIEVNTGGEGELNVETDRLRAEVSMGGVIELEGTSKRTDLKANMGSEISAKDLTTEYGYIKSSMGSEISLTVLDEVEASAGMGAEVTIYGDPTRVYTSDSFGGEIRVKDNL